MLDRRRNGAEPDGQRERREFVASFGIVWCPASLIRKRSAKDLPRMSFLVFKGTIKVIHESVDFPEGSTHAYVCVAAETELQRALEAAHIQAKELGLAIVTVDGSPMCVPAWRAWLWTAQGRALREAAKLGVVLTITRDAVDPNVVIGG